MEEQHTRLTRERDSTFPRHVETLEGPPFWNVVFPRDLLCIGEHDLDGDSNVHDGDAQIPTTQPELDSRVEAQYTDPFESSALIAVGPLCGILLFPCRLVGFPK